MTTAQSPRVRDTVTGRGAVALHYVARAGLLTELSRQTYDSLYKALREAVLNSVDAGATQVVIDLSGVAARGEMLVEDDGRGMDLREFTDHFMSLGGSSKFGQADQFGRIGIGSLALLQYASAATVETKRSGSPTVTVARLEHPWSLVGSERRAHLDEVPAGEAKNEPYAGDTADHFTRLRLTGVSEAVVEAERDPSSLYRLVDDLRRVLPLTWGESRIRDSLRDTSSDVAEVLDEHMARWSVPVVIRSHGTLRSTLRVEAMGTTQAGLRTGLGVFIRSLRRSA